MSFFHFTIPSICEEEEEKYFSFHSKCPNRNENEIMQREGGGGGVNEKFDKYSSSFILSSSLSFAFIINSLNDESFHQL